MSEHSAFYDPFYNPEPRDMGPMSEVALTCEWCHTEFNRPSRKGPIPKFCSHGHRQRAFEKRHFTDRIAELTKELRAARTQIDRWGYGDFHYGAQQRDTGVLEALRAIDRVLGKS